MNRMFKAAVCAALTIVCLCCALSALAAEEILSKTLEETITHEDTNIRITVDRWCYAYKRANLRFYVAHVYVNDPMQLRTAFAGDKYSKTNAEATSEIAARHGAVLAINGDYYNYKDNIGLVIRNGELFRDKAGARDHLLIDSEGAFIPVPKLEYQYGHGEEYIAQGIQQSFTFGPILVQDGAAIALPEKYIINTKDSIREPRAAIGYVEKNHYVVVVADGRRKDWSDKGMTLEELQQVFVEQGCQTAYNLDGGGSATLVLCGEVVNRASGSRERNVSDIVYFAN